MNDRHTKNGASEPAIGAEEQLAADRTAAALDELTAAERAKFATLSSADAASGDREQLAGIRRLADALRTATAAEAAGLQPSADLRAKLMAELQKPADDELKAELAKTERRRWLKLTGLEWTVIAGIVCILVALNFQFPVRHAREAASRNQVIARAQAPSGTTSATPEVWEAPPAGQPEHWSMSTSGPQPATPDYDYIAPIPDAVKQQTQGVRALQETGSGPQSYSRFADGAEVDGLKDLTEELEAAPAGSDRYRAVNGPTRLGIQQRISGRHDNYWFDANGATETFEFRQQPDGTTVQLPQLAFESNQQEAKALYSDYGLVPSDGLSSAEQYDAIVENAFLSPTAAPLSTFSIDVDTASYSNVRRFLTSGRLPPPAAVRIEELVNYFRYDYPQPTGDDPFSVNMEATACPWNDKHLLLRVGLQGKQVHKAERPVSNLVFLLDVSGSMDEPNKLPLVKESISLLVKELGENDRVSIAVYAGNAGLVLPPTSGDQKQKILAAIESLTPGGSTHGSAGIQLAYEQAAAYFRKGGTNRVILATDGDLNVGVTDDNALVELIKEKATGGVFLTVLGFGEGNLKDSKMEKIADNGNGMYAYIDSIREGRKVLVEQLSGSIVTIAKDVKVQIEFNPAVIESYRLIGYENRMLAAKDFNDDKKDAGEIGAGHTVTALYELVPAGAAAAAGATPAEAPEVDPLKYQKRDEPAKTVQPAATEAAASGELLTLKLRYKQPDGDTSKLLEYPLQDRGGSFNSASPDLQFAASVASFGMLLRQSEYKGSGNIAAVQEIAAGALGKDDGGYRAEFVELVKQAAARGVK